MQHLVYNTETGQIQRTGTCSKDTLANQAGDGEVAIENTGNWNDIDHKVVNGSVVELTQQEKDSTGPEPIKPEDMARHVTNKDWDDLIGRIEKLETKE